MSNTKNEINGNLIYIDHVSESKIARDRTKLETDFGTLLQNAWGNFSADFIDRHIFHAKKIVCAYQQNKCIGLCVTSKKNIEGRHIWYVEFLVIHKDWQRTGLGSKLIFRALLRDFLSFCWEIVVQGYRKIFFISPNIRVLSLMSKFALEVYPNPTNSDQTGCVLLADDKTWVEANELLRQSDNPARRLDREALVLHGSYASTPWLIYNSNNAPWHEDIKINTFAKKYLGYMSSADREFIVSAKIGFGSILKYISSKW